jgi:hypothetical protein
MSPLLIVSPALALVAFLWWGAFVQDRNAERAFAMLTEDDADA